MSVLLTHINASLEHESGKGDSLNPRVEAEGEEKAEDEEDNAGGPVLLVEIEDGGSNGEADVEDAGDPDKLLGEKAGKPHVGVREDEGDDENKGEKNNGVAVEREAVGGTVNIAAVGSGCVAVDGNARDCNEASEDEEELESVSFRASPSRER